MVAICGSLSMMALPSFSAICMKDGLLNMLPMALMYLLGGKGNKIRHTMANNVSKLQAGSIHGAHVPARRHTTKIR